MKIKIDENKLAKVILESVKKKLNEEQLPYESFMSSKKYDELEKVWLGYVKGLTEKYISDIEKLTEQFNIIHSFNYCGSNDSDRLRELIYNFFSEVTDNYDETIEPNMNDYNFWDEDFDTSDDYPEENDEY